MSWDKTCLIFMRYTFCTHWTHLMIFGWFWATWQLNWLKLQWKLYNLKLCVSVCVWLCSVESRLTWAVWHIPFPLGCALLGNGCSARRSPFPSACEPPHCPIDPTHTREKNKNRDVRWNNAGIQTSWWGKIRVGSYFVQEYFRKK